MVCATPRTLIADDQPDVIEALRLLLKREGYQIEAANSPRAVLERLEARDFDLLLIDGSELCARYHVGPGRA
jgi:CheY-like chemotaxis protein